MPDGGGYKKLSWHITLMAFAPYSDWRRAMRFTEIHGYSADIKTSLKQKDAYLNGSLPSPTNYDEWGVALLADSHILANSKGQYIQSLHSEKVEAGTPATGIRFKFEGVYNHNGLLHREILQLGSSEADLMAYVATSMSMQDPWSIVAEKKVFVEEEEDAVKKRATKRKHSEENLASSSKPTGKKESKSNGSSLDNWELLPKSESKWMRGLLEVPGASFLTTLPCIKDEKIMPSEVFNIVNNGRGQILFYANVVHVVLCPRYLVNGNLIHRHHNDSAVAICISENVAGRGVVHRLFVRCFSEKCMHFSKSLFQTPGCRKSKDKQIPSKWEEYLSSHFLRYARLLQAEKKTAAPTTAHEAT